MKINGLTGSRAIAALWVVIHHYGGQLFPFRLFGKLFTSGNLAVSYFFVLSGFILYLTQQRTTTVAFYRNRLSRIAPPYLIALLMTVLVILHFHSFVPANLESQIVCSLLFVQSYFPSYALELNSPAWSLSVEMTFYLLFPALLFLANRSEKLFLSLTLITFIVSQYIHLHYWANIDPINGSGIYFNPLIHLNEFMIGMVGARLFSTARIRVGKPALTLTFFATMIIISIGIPGVSFHAGLLAPLYIIIIIGIAQHRMRLLSTNVMVFLGEISYGIYIYQYPVFKYFEKIRPQFPVFNDATWFVAGLAALLVVAVLSYKLIEVPTIRFFKRWQLSRN